MNYIQRILILIRLVVGEYYYSLIFYTFTVNFLSNNVKLLYLSTPKRLFDTFHWKVCLPELNAVINRIINMSTAN